MFIMGQSSNKYREREEYILWANNSFKTLDMIRVIIQIKGASRLYLNTAQLGQFQPCAIRCDKGKKFSECKVCSRDLPHGMLKFGICRFWHTCTLYYFLFCTIQIYSLFSSQKKEEKKRFNLIKA